MGAGLIAAAAGLTAGIAPTVPAVGGRIGAGLTLGGVMGAGTAAGVVAATSCADAELNERRANAQREVESFAMV